MASNDILFLDEASGDRSQPPVRRLLTVVKQLESDSHVIPGNRVFLSYRHWPKGRGS